MCAHNRGSVSEHGHLWKKTKSTKSSFCSASRLVSLYSHLYGLHAVLCFYAIVLLLGYLEFGKYLPLHKALFFKVLSVARTIGKYKKSSI